MSTTSPGVRRTTSSPPLTTAFVAVAFALACLAVVVLPTGLAHAETSSAVARVAPTRLTGAPALQRTGDALSVRTPGRLVVPDVPDVLECPAGVTDPSYCAEVAPEVCSGTVRVVIRQGDEVVSSRLAPLRADCSYVGVAQLSRSSIDPDEGALVVRAQFGGNDFLLRRTGRSRTLRVGDA